MPNDDLSEAGRRLGKRSAEAVRKKWGDKLSEEMSRRGKKGGRPRKKKTTEEAPGTEPGVSSTPPPAPAWAAPAKTPVTASRRPARTRPPMPTPANYPSLEIGRAHV